jgi:hypothetical protein
MGSVNGEFWFNNLMFNALGHQLALVGVPAIAVLGPSPVNGHFASFDIHLSFVAVNY